MWKFMFYFLLLCSITETSKQTVKKKKRRVPRSVSESTGNQGHNFSTPFFSSHLEDANLSLCEKILKDVEDANISSPAYPVLPDGFINCDWTVLAKGNCVTNLTFHTMDLPEPMWNGKCVACYIEYGKFDYEGNRVIHKRMCGSRESWSYFAYGAIWIHLSCTRINHIPHMGFTASVSVREYERAVIELCLGIGCFFLLPLFCCLPACSHYFRERKSQLYDKERMAYWQKWLEKETVIKRCNLEKKKQKEQVKKTIVRLSQSELGRSVLQTTGYDYTENTNLENNNEEKFIEVFEEEGELREREASVKLGRTFVLTQMKQPDDFQYAAEEHDIFNPRPDSPFPASNSISDLDSTEMDFDGSDAELRQQRYYLGDPNAQPKCGIASSTPLPDSNANITFPIGTDSKGLSSSTDAPPPRPARRRSTLLRLPTLESITEQSNEYSSSGASSTGTKRQTCEQKRHSYSTVDCTNVTDLDDDVFMPRAQNVDTGSYEHLDKIVRETRESALSSSVSLPANLDNAVILSSDKDFAHLDNTYEKAMANRRRKMYRTPPPCQRFLDVELHESYMPHSHRQRLPPRGSSTYFADVDSFLTHEVHRGEGHSFGDSSHGSYGPPHHDVYLEPGADGDTRIGNYSGSEEQKYVTSVTPTVTSVTPVIVEAAPSSTDFTDIESENTMNYGHSMMTAFQSAFEESEMSVDPENRLRVPTATTFRRTWPFENGPKETVI